MRSWRWDSDFLASTSNARASARESLSAIAPTALSNCLRLSRSLSRTLTQSGRNSGTMRSEEHTSELQSRLHLVCRLLLEIKKLLSSPHTCYHIFTLCILSPQKAYLHDISLRPLDCVALFDQPILDPLTRTATPTRHFIAA